MGDFIEKAGFEPIPGDYKDLNLYEKEDIALISMLKFKEDKYESRQAGNHLDKRMIKELRHAFRSLGKKHPLKSVILTSSHKVVFSRGAKIEVLYGANQDECRCFIHEAQELILQIQNFSLPVIAAITGLTYGGGLELAAACDYRISSSRDNVVFGMPETSLGIIPGMGGTQNLPRLAGKLRAFKIISDAVCDISPDKALTYGLVDRVVPAKSLIEEAVKLSLSSEFVKRRPHLYTASSIFKRTITDEITRHLETHSVSLHKEDVSAPLSRLLLKFLFDKMEPDGQPGRNYINGLLYEQEILCYLQQTADCQEGLKALIEERKAVFCGK